MGGQNKDKSYEDVDSLEENLDRKRNEEDEKAKAERKRAKARGGHKQLSGRQLFLFDPSQFITSDDTTDLTAKLNSLKAFQDEEEVEAIKTTEKTETEEPIIQEKTEIKEKTDDPAPVISLQVGDLSLFEDDLGGLDELDGLDL